MNALRNMYGLRRVCLAVTSLLLSASTIHLLNLPLEPSTTNLAQALNDLQTMSLNHTFAARCVDIIRSLAGKWNINLPDGSSPASTFRHDSRRSEFSPTTSTFWAATIPRNDSGQSSGTSSHSRHESPFQAPNGQPQDQQPGPPLFSDPAMQMDPTHMQDLFWTPFPGQTMPIATQNLLSGMPMDMSGMEDNPPQWQMFSNAPGSMDSQQHNNMTRWQWRSNA